MALTSTQTEELNRLLQDRKIQIPDFRRTITVTGSNTQWLKKNIHTRNPNLPERVKELIALI